MKRVVSGCILAAMLLGMVACGGKPAPTDPPVSQSAVLTTEPTEAPTQPTEMTEPPLAEGFPYLTVSSIDFSVVGESEDIYVGSIPREEVTWVSEDESVAVFQDGVLTATGVGETSAYAEYNGQRITCSVGCLAQTEEELAQLPWSVLRSPKRLPPQNPEGECSFYSDAAIVGDSISYIMFQWHSKRGGLDGALFLTRGGVSLNGFVRRYKRIYYKGEEMDVEDALSAAGRKKVFIMLGQNDLSYMTTDEVMENWDIFLGRIREKNPDIEVYLQSCIPEWQENTAKNTKNEKIYEHNQRLKEMAEEEGYHFIDLWAYTEDHVQKMPTQYSLDKSIHMNEEGCMMWIGLLRSYAELQTLKGEE